MQEQFPRPTSRSTKAVSKIVRLHSPTLKPQTPASTTPLDFEAEGRLLCPKLWQESACLEAEVRARTKSSNLFQPSLFGPFQVLAKALARQHDQYHYEEALRGYFTIKIHCLQAARAKLQLGDLFCSAWGGASHV